MELIERSEFLSALQLKFEAVAKAEGHTVVIGGEAGIGKTSVVKVFCKQIKNSCKIFHGSCDALFTPRPLAPLYDIIWQMESKLENTPLSNLNRADLFVRLFHELEKANKPTVIVIEDIHWADEATLDFIKFFARRINQIHCLLILTYRDDEISSEHPLRTVFGQLPADNFTRMNLARLSRQAVEKLAERKGYKVEDVYTISGGNPFYVNEILASYNSGIPANIINSVLSSYNRLDEKSKRICQVLSVMPTGLELKHFSKIDTEFEDSVHHCLDLKILVHSDGLVTFKHELYRRTVETSLSPLLRITLNKKVLTSFQETFEENNQPERIIHYAKNANENEIVVKYAPIAAKQSATLGSHIEASKLFLSAIEYYQGNDNNLLLEFYEGYAYECYLTNQIKEAIIYTTKALNIWTERQDQEKIGNSMRFLSRLWWYDGNAKKAEAFSIQAIDVFRNQPSSAAKAMALSNMSQLKMLYDQADECIFWGEKAISMSKEVSNDEILCHALNNVGTVQARNQSTRQRGIELLQQSLEISLKNSFEEHAARAYSNLGNSGVLMRDHELAKKILQPGITYCEERDLDSWSKLLYSLNARIKFESGNWDDAKQIAEDIITRAGHSTFGQIDTLAIIARIKMRRGDLDVIPLLQEAKTIAHGTPVLGRMIPAFVASLEYEWITGTKILEDSSLDVVITLISQIGNLYENSEFAFWMLKARGKHILVRELFAGYNVDNVENAIKAAEIWKKLDCPYEQALALFEGTEDDKRTAITILHKLDASMIIEKLKLEMRSSGIKSIPRGSRKTNRSNAANLTERELDILYLLKEGLQNKEIASRLFISAKTVDNHISSILYKLEVNSRIKAVQEASQLGILK